MKTTQCNRPDHPESVYVRPPLKGEVCKHSGLRRSSFRKLIDGSNPAIPSIVIAQPGKKRGIRVVRLQDLIEYIESRAGTTETKKFAPCLQPSSGNEGESVKEHGADVKALLARVSALHREAGAVQEQLGVPDFIANSMVALSSSDEAAVELFVTGDLP